MLLHRCRDDLLAAVQMCVTLSRSDALTYLLGLPALAISPQHIRTAMQSAGLGIDLFSVDQANVTFQCSGVMEMTEVHRTDLNAAASMISLVCDVDAKRQYLEHRNTT